MPETDVDEAVVTDVTNRIENFSVGAETTDGAEGSGETTWQDQEWSSNLGYYKSIPELKTAIDTKATWTVGAGYETDEATDMLLGTIKGNGKDSFNSILKNMIKVMIVTGDSYAEIMIDDEIVVNLKPLDPSTIKIVQNSKGIIDRYEQTSKINKTIRKYAPDKILHFSRERIADEIHGISAVKSVQWIIDARNEAMNDWRRVLHRNVAPLFIFHLDTDDTAQIAALKIKYENARKDGENLFVPKGVIEPEIVTTAANANLSPLAWIDALNDLFFQAVNVPQIIIGNAKEFTDASGKIVYLSYEQSVKADQLYVEEQILNQLNIEIELTFPASLQNEAVSDTPTPEPQETAAQPADTEVETNENQDQ